jgi:hypothetical protein
VSWDADGIYVISIVFKLLKWLSEDRNCKPEAKKFENPNRTERQERWMLTTDHMNQLSLAFLNFCWLTAQVGFNRHCFVEIIY